MTDAELEVRRHAAARARQVLDGALTPAAFLEEFADVEDRAVAELLDLIEHEPGQGILGGGENAWRSYQASVREIIASLSA